MHLALIGARGHLNAPDELHIAVLLRRLLRLGESGERVVVCEGHGAKSSLVRVGHKLCRRVRAVRCARMGVQIHSSKHG